jgi:type IV pilus assembly protein PilE
MTFAIRNSAAARYAIMQKARGFTLIELMIVVAIIGILSVIGIPAYNDYVTRGKLVDATSKLADMRIQLEQYYQDNRNYGSTSSSCGLAMPTSKYFAISCKWGASGDNQSYKITATGTINKTNFTFTIDESNNKTSSGWGNGTTCWITRKGDTC